MTALLRLLFLAAAVFGAYKIYPQVRPQIQQTLGDPRVLGETVYTPIANTINQALPSNLKLPTPKSPAKRDLATPDSPSTPNSSAISNIANSVVDQVKQKATDLAKDQIDNLKQEAGKAFCQALLEKIKTECGAN